MILSTKTRYAVVAMIDLLEENLKDPQKPVTLLSIANRQAIPLQFLEKIFSSLKKSGIVKAIKGPGGGYIISKKFEEISISDIVIATGESFKITACAQGASCKEKSNFNLSNLNEISLPKKCRTHDLWAGLENNINNYLKSVSILGLIKC